MSAVGMTVSCGDTFAAEVKRVALNTIDVKVVCESSGTGGSLYFLPRIHRHRDEAALLNLFFSNRLPPNHLMKVH